ncbi:6072_t:CDS:10 [Funneliformis caledonium]|uniref:6072_t:CDS:1 n=1 Tax=Funneliformis caledonium TaxID=1117310 RepID=A0A9N9FFG9_9GLOM|nr:6072_t:CDS:10 [Funneliformis caledonium]
MADIKFFSSLAKKSFLRPHTSTLPGSVKPVESKTGATKLVIGAKYSFGQIVSNSSDDLSYLQSRSSQSLSSPRREPSPNPSGSTFSSETNNESDEDDLSMDKLKIHNHAKESQTINKDHEKMSEINSNRSIFVEKSSIGLKPDIALLIQGNSLAISSMNFSNVVIGRLNEPLERCLNKFKDVLQSANIDLAALKKQSWLGIPDELRSITWQLLLEYLPCNADRQVKTLARKRKEYIDLVSQTYSKGIAGLNQTIWHQIHIDVPRTNPGIALYQYETTQQCLERILYLWSVRHPASEYVQGINDLVTPFFQVFLSFYIDENPENYDTSNLPKDVLDVIEADSYWCLSKLLDGIQDNYTFAQSAHLQEEGVEYIQFAFRWMNCLLMREMSLKHIIRMWDTYLAEGSEGFSVFHLYVCVAFLNIWSDKLRSMEFQEIMMFLQSLSLPTAYWTERDIKELLAEAFRLKSLYHEAPNHLSRV